MDCKHDARLGTQSVEPSSMCLSPAYQCKQETTTTTLLGPICILALPQGIDSRISIQSAFSTPSSPDTSRFFLLLLPFLSLRCENPHQYIIEIKWPKKKRPNENIKKYDSLKATKFHQENLSQSLV